MFVQPVSQRKGLCMKNIVDFKNYLRGMDTLESDVIDAESQAAVAKRLAALVQPMRRQIAQNMEHHLLKGRINLPRRKK
jgi:hypothetical protein